MTVKLLSSGFWYVRNGLNRFAQWPAHRPPRDDEFFGWWSEQDKQDVLTLALKAKGEAE